MVDSWVEQSALMKVVLMAGLKGVPKAEQMAERTVASMVQPKDAT